MKPVKSDPNVWIIRDSSDKRRKGALENDMNNNSIDPSETHIQEWLIEIAALARNDTSLGINPQLTWIEALKDFAIESGYGFPIPKDLFTGVVQLLKVKSSFFRKLVEREIATKSPGITGEHIFTSVTVLSEVPPDYTGGGEGEEVLNKWQNFTSRINSMVGNDNLPDINAQVR